MLTIYSWFDFIPISTLLVADNKEEDTKSVSFFICDLGWFFVVFPAVFYSVSAPTGPMFFSIWICFCSNIVSSHLQMFLTWKTPHNVPFISLRTSVIWSQIATCSVCDSLSITVLQMRELYGFLHDTIADKCYLATYCHRRIGRRSRQNTDLKSCFYLCLSLTFNLHQLICRLGCKND